MINLYNQDSSFFSVKSPDISEKVLSEDIIQFTYDEEVGKYNTGSISMYDPDNYYSKVLRNGAKLEVSFGYASTDSSINSLLAIQKNPTQLLGSVRTGIKGYINNPNGGGASNGVITFNCNFYGGEYLGEKQSRVHIGVTKGVLVRQLLTELGCIATQINFTRQNETLNQNTQIFQRETNYKLLLRFAREWRAIFRIGYNATGNLTAVFISPQNISSVLIPKLLTGSIAGDSILLEYQEGVANTVEYKWKNHAGNSGSGDNVRIVTGADGRPTFIRYVTQGDTVKAYKLNTDKIKKRLKGTDSFSDRFAKIKEWVQVNDFKKIIWAFDPVEISTAPQGLGYSLEATILGSPMMSAPLKVFFGQGFPVWFTPSSPKTHVSQFYARRVGHTIDRSGYKTTLEIMDAFTATGGSLI